jgi:hypothetical protein
VGGASTASGPPPVVVVWMTRRCRSRSAILAFAMEATTPGINVNALGIILLLIGLVAVLYSLLFWEQPVPLGSPQNCRPPPHGGRGATR